MVSEVQKFGVVKKDYAGLRMVDLTPEIKPVVKVTMATSLEEKLVQNGVFAIDRHGDDSWKFAPEVVFSVYGKDAPYIHKRPFNDGWFRCEIPVPLNTAIKMLESALHKLWLVA